MKNWVISVISLLAAVFLMAIMAGREDFLGGAFLVLAAIVFISEFGYANLIHFVCLHGLQHADRVLRRQSERSADLMQRRIQFLERAR